jgi:hypothetical protein
MYTYIKTMDNRAIRAMVAVLSMDDRADKIDHRCSGRRVGIPKEREGGEGREEAERRGVTGGRWGGAGFRRSLSDLFRRATI